MVFSQVFDPANSSSAIPDPSGNPYIGDGTTDGLQYSSVGLALTINAFQIASNGLTYTVPQKVFNLTNEKYYQFLYKISDQSWLFDPKDSELELLHDPDRVLIMYIYTFNNTVYYTNRKILSSISVRQKKRREFAYSVLDWQKQFAITDAPYTSLIKDAIGGGFTAYFQLTALYLIGSIPEAWQIVKNAIYGTFDYCTTSWWKSQATYTAGQHIIAQGMLWRCAVGGQVSIDPTFTGSYTLGATVVDNAVTWVAMATAPMAIATKRNHPYMRGTATYQDGFLWICTTAGTSAGSAPSYAGHVVTDTVTDGGAVFTAIRADIPLQCITAEARNWYLTDFNGIVPANRSFTYIPGIKTVQNGWIWTATTTGSTAASSPFTGSYARGNTVIDGTVTWRADIDLTKSLNSWGWRREDSNDSYPALMIYALNEYMKRTGDVAIVNHVTKVPKASSGYYTILEILIELNYDNILNNIQPDYGLTNTFKNGVTPESDIYEVCFFGDNCETGNGEYLFADIHRMNYEAGSASAALSDPTVQANILSYWSGLTAALGGLYDATEKNFAWFAGAVNSAMEPRLNYPDCFAQRMASEHSIALPYEYKYNAMKWQEVENWQLHQGNLSSELPTVALMAKNGQVSKQFVDESVDAWIDLYASEGKGSALDYAAYLSLTQS